MQQHSPVWVIPASPFNPGFIYKTIHCRTCSQIPSSLSLDSAGLPLHKSHFSWGSGAVAPNGSTPSSSLQHPQVSCGLWLGRGNAGVIPLLCGFKILPEEESALFGNAVGGGLGVAGGSVWGQGWLVPCVPTVLEQGMCQECCCC